jgi:hypothetical protein
MLLHILCTFGLCRMRCSGSGKNRIPALRSIATAFCDDDRIGFECSRGRAAWEPEIAATEASAWRKA